MSAKSELRLTDTNAATLTPRAGTWEQRRPVLVRLISGIGTGITSCFFVLLVPAQESLAMSFVHCARAGVALPHYIFALRQGQPPGYDRDLFECVLQPESGALARKPSIPVSIPFYESKNRNLCHRPFAGSGLSWFRRR